MGASSSTVISLIPEASAVKEGDVLARLDASTYEEMLRQQTIVVEQAKASYLQAELNHEIAKIALREYVEGTAKELVQEMNATIYLARSGLNQAQERLEWTKKMNKKGYASVAQMETDKQTVMTSDLALQRQVAAYDLFERFTLPKTKMTLQADITTSQDDPRERTGQAQPAGGAVRAAQEAGGHAAPSAPPTTASSTTTSIPIRDSDSERMPDRGRDVRPTEAEALLPARPDRDGGPGHPERVGRQPGQPRPAGEGRVRGAARSCLSKDRSRRSARSPTGSTPAARTSATSSACSSSTARARGSSPA